MTNSQAAMLALGATLLAIGVPLMPTAPSRSWLYVGIGFCVVGSLMVIASVVHILTTPSRATPHPTGLDKEQRALMRESLSGYVLKGQNILRRRDRSKIVQDAGAWLDEVETYLDDALGAAYKVQSRLDAQLPDPVITAPGAAMPRHFTEPMNRRFQNLLDIIKELS
jgi:hypothetical protein